MVIEQKAVRPNFGGERTAMSEENNQMPVVEYLHISDCGGLKALTIYICYYTVGSFLTYSDFQAS
jgi:hypothetical protein